VVVVVGGIPSDYLVSTQLQLWLFCCLFNTPENVKPKLFLNPYLLFFLYQILI